MLKKLRKLQNLYEGAKAINSEGEAANAALDEYVAEKFGKTGSRKGSRINSAQAYNSGYEDGKNTEIYKPIAQSHRKNAESVQLLK